MSSETEGFRSVILPNKSPQTVGEHQEIPGTLGSSSILQQPLNVDGGTDRQVDAPIRTHLRGRRR